MPNLVATVQGYAKQEKEVLTQVTEARAKATSIHLDADDLTDPEKVKQMQQAQSPAFRRARPPARRQRKLSGSQVEPELPRPAVAARGHREPDRRRPQGLHRRGAGFQHLAQDLPDRDLGRRRCSASNKPMAPFTAEAEAQAAPKVKF